MPKINDELFLKFIILVKNMRDAQRKYDQPTGAINKAEALRNALDCEKVIDDLLETLEE